MKAERSDFLSQNVEVNLEREEIPYRNLGKPVRKRTCHKNLRGWLDCVNFRFKIDDFVLISHCDCPNSSRIPVQLSASQSEHFRPG